ncbi:MAG: prepilin-type N-terminal cleavage/methylation domain-containing protein [Candidatus Colwellbacteria bacterium]|nr:prepilin-type N-terminal cleavage/methylation domain-containing protein [Candidatus Colwellbacteria bacterium]
MPISKSSGSFRPHRRGFTLIEVVVVMGVMAVLSSMMLGYGQRNNKQILLVTSQAKIASIFSRAKFLSIQSFFNLAGTNEYVCAYGVLITYPDTISIFKSVSDDDTPCPGPRDLSDTDYIEEYSEDRGQIFVPLSGELNQVQLSDKGGVELCRGGGDCDSGAEDYFIFIPPEPIVKFEDDNTEERLTVDIRFKDETEGEAPFSVTVTKDGQIQTK